jgi:hypothetical protein
MNMIDQLVMDRPRLFAPAPLPSQQMFDTPHGDDTTVNSLFASMPASARAAQPPRPPRDTRLPQHLFTGITPNALPVASLFDPPKEDNSLGGLFHGMNTPGGGRLNEGEPARRVSYAGAGGSVNQNGRPAPLPMPTINWEESAEGMSQPPAPIHNVPSQRTTGQRRTEDVKPLPLPELF